MKVVALVLLLLLNLSLGLEKTEVNQPARQNVPYHTFLIAIDFSSPFSGLLWG
jgi:hypothetical protein